MKLLNKGDKLYIPSKWSISNGFSDIAGGVATISEITIDKRLGINHMNGIFVKFEEVPGTSYNYKYLIKDQENLEKEYQGKIAHPDPDIDTPWIEEGDLVNGQPYIGKSIW